MMRPGRGMALLVVGTALGLLHPDSDASAQARRDGASADGAPAAARAQDPSACPDADVQRCYREWKDLRYRVFGAPPDGVSAVNDALARLLGDVGRASFDVECGEQGGDGGTICTAVVRKGTADGGDGEGGVDAIHLAVEPRGDVRDARAVRVRFRGSADGSRLPEDAVAPGILAGAGIEDGDYRRYDAVLGPEAWAAAPEKTDAGWRPVVVGRGDGAVESIGELPPMEEDGAAGEARLRSVLQLLADRPDRFCASDEEALWLTFDASDDCEQQGTLRSWRIWHGGGRRRSGGRRAPGTLRLQTKLPVVEVDLEGVLDLAARLGVDDPDPMVMLTRHGEVIRPSGYEDALLRYRVAVPSRDDVAPDMFDLRVAAPEDRRGTFGPIEEDDAEDMLHEAIAESGRAGGIGALDVHGVPGGGGTAIFGREAGVAHVSALHVWIPGLPAGALTPVSLGEKTRPDPTREADIAAALRGMVKPGGEVHLGGAAETLRLCSHAQAPWRRVAFDGAGQMDVPLWADGEDVACAKYRQRDWEPMFEAVAAIAGKRGGQGVRVALASGRGGRDFVAEPIETGAGPAPRHVLWRTAPVTNTGCETRLGGRASADLIRYLSAHEDLECLQTEEVDRASGAPAESGPPRWAAGLRTRGHEMILLAEDCRDLTLRPLGPEDPAARPEVGADLAEQFRTFVEEHPAPACEAEEGEWLVALDRLFVVVGGSLTAADDGHVTAALDRELEERFVRMTARWMASRPGPPAEESAPPGRAPSRRAGAAAGAGAAGNLRARRIDGHYVMIDVGLGGGTRYHDAGIVLDETRCAGRVARRDSVPPAFTAPVNLEKAGRAEPGAGYRCEVIVVGLALFGKNWQPRPTGDGDGRTVRGLRSVAVARNVVVRSDPASLVACLRALAQAEVDEACDADVTFETGAGEPLDAVNNAVTDRRALLAAVLKAAVPEAAAREEESSAAVDFVAAVAGSGWRLAGGGPFANGFVLENSGAGRLRFDHLHGTCVDVAADAVLEVVETVLRGTSTSEDRTGLDWILDIVELRRGPQGRDRWWRQEFTRDPLWRIAAQGRACMD